LDANQAVLPNETSLLGRAVGEPEAFAAVYDHYFPRIWNYVRYRVNDAAVADDLTAAIFERALTRLRDYDPARGTFAVWLFALARNAVTDFYRRRTRRRWVPLEQIRDLPSDDPQPGEAVMEAETRVELLRAVAALADRERDILGLKFAGGLTNRRIAKMMGLSESNVAVIIFRTIRRLRTRLEAGSEQG
jgi:RNA polymerase sigma-70 factor, ECF subfamily